jgi:hypothetical protein
MLKLLVMLHDENGALVDKYVVDVLVDDHEVGATVTAGSGWWSRR